MSELESYKRWVADLEAERAALRAERQQAIDALRESREFIAWAFEKHGYVYAQNKLDLLDAALESFGERPAQ